MCMRPLLLGVMFSLFPGALVIEACGGVESTSTPDAGATEAGQKGGDASEDPDAVVPAECDASTDLTTGVPDASTADGATTSGLCIGCISTACKNSLDECGTVCNCRAVVHEALACFGQGRTPVSCLTGTTTQPTSATEQIGLGLLTCVQLSCRTECAASSFLPGDAGHEVDAGDGGDASGD